MAIGRRLLVAWLLSLACTQALAAPRTAVVIALDGAIGPGSASYVVRSLKQAQRQDAAVVVVRMDTPGGLDSAMREIIRAMLASPVPVLAYVAPAGARAASAGTYILYAAALAAMAPGTNLGAASPVSLFAPTPLAGSDAKSGDDGGKAGPPAKAGPRDAELTKVTNDAVAYIRGLASLHGRNADWAEQAVREAASLPYDVALEQHVIDLVAADLPDLLARANGRSVLVQGKPLVLDTSGLVIAEVEPGWRDRLLALLTDPSIVYLLLLAGLFGIAFEASHPGVYAPGVVGVICALVGGYGLNLLPIDYAGLALVLLGLGLMAAEAFVPSFGAFVLGGMSAFVIGSLLMFEAPGVRLPLAVIVGAALASALLLGVVLTLLVRARRRPKVSDTAALVGAPGQTLSGWTGQVGEVMVHGERWRARAAGLLRSGQPIRVVGRDGLILIVEAPEQRDGTTA
jgi:membrane-bound serine protease (ClpP class)